jgi:hypothetical protein
MNETDDTIRSHEGVVACLRDNGDGTSKLIFDDVDANSTTNPIQWSFSCFYTWGNYSDSDLNQMKLSPQEYQAIGENLVARLLARNGRLK